MKPLVQFANDNFWKVAARRQMAAMVLALLLGLGVSLASARAGDEDKSTAQVVTGDQTTISGGDYTLLEEAGQLGVLPLGKFMGAVIRNLVGRGSEVIAVEPPDRDLGHAELLRGL